LKEELSRIWFNIQGKLFPHLEKTTEEPLTEKSKQLATVLELVRIENFIRTPSYWHGQSPKSRKQIARSFIAKSIYNMPSNRHLIDMLKVSPVLRRICGWEKVSQVPHEATFSRAFKEFSKSGIVSTVHEYFIKRHLGEVIVGHVSRDATAIEAREKPEKKKESVLVNKKVYKKRGRPKKGDERIEEPTRLEKQRAMTLEEMLKDLPKTCDFGNKKDSKGHQKSWIGYKLHIDAADGQIPISCILTSASVHDSQAALPLAAITNERITNLYDLMDSAYDSPIIIERSKLLGHVPIIDINPRRDKKLKEDMESEKRRQDIINFKAPEAVRYNERSNVERVNGRLKDEFGGETVRVRGWRKVMTHLMFGILVLSADQLIRLIL